MPDRARTMLQRDDKAPVVLAQEAVQVLEEAELWAIQPVGLQHMLHNLRLQHRRALLGKTFQHGTCSMTFAIPQILMEGKHELHWEIPWKDSECPSSQPCSSSARSCIASDVPQQRPTVSKWERLISLKDGAGRLTVSQPFARSPARSCMHQRALVAACSRSLVGWSEALSAAPTPGMDPWSAAPCTSGAAAPAWQANLHFSGPRCLAAH